MTTLSNTRSNSTAYTAADNAWARQANTLENALYTHTDAFGYSLDSIETKGDRHDFEGCMDHAEELLLEALAAVRAARHAAQKL